MNPRVATDHQPVATRRRRAWITRTEMVTVAGIVAGISLAAMDGDVLAFDTDPGPSLSVDDPRSELDSTGSWAVVFADRANTSVPTVPTVHRLEVVDATLDNARFSAAAAWTNEVAESAAVTVPPRTSAAPRDRSTINGLRVLFRRVAIVLFVGVLAVARMVFGRLFRRR